MATEMNLTGTNSGMEGHLLTQTQSDEVDRLRRRTGGTGTGVVWLLKKVLFYAIPALLLVFEWHSADTKSFGDFLRDAMIVVSSLLALICIRKGGL